MLKTTNYFSTFETENNTLKRIITAEGQAVPMGEKGFEYQYFLKDHLGSTRVVLNQNKHIEQQNSYYPFGMLMSGLPATNTYTTNKYLYNGKELQDDFSLDWYDYGARFYDAQLGRWHVPDPLQQFHSPYTYAGNNPISNIDQSGMYSYNWTTKEYENSSGEFVSWEEVEANNFQEPEKQKDDKKDSETKKGPSLARQFINGIPVIGSALSSGDKLASGDYIGATADFGYALAEMFTLGYLSEYKIAGSVAKTGETILGKYPDYINLASKTGAKRFNIPTNIWNRMTNAEQWAANSKFLDRAIARGQKFVLSNRVTDINKVNGAFRKELDYLISKGYRLSSDGLKMIK